MKQLSVCASNTATSAAATRWQGVLSSVIQGSWNATEASIRTVIPCSGTLRNLRVNIVSVPGAGKNYIFTVKKNGVDTLLACTIADTNTTASNITDQVSVTAGDLIIMSCVPSGTPGTSSGSTWTVEFEGNTANQNYLAGGTNVAPVATTINANNPAVGDTWIDITAGLIPEIQAACLIPHSCTIRAIYVNLRTAPGTGGSGKGWKVYIRKNGVKQASSEFTVSETATTGNITGLSIALVAGDYITIAFEGVSTPAITTPGFGWGILLESATDGESILARSSTNGSAVTSARWWRIGNYDQVPTSPENTRQTVVGPTGYTIKNMIVAISTAVAAASTLIWRSRKNSANGNMTFTMSTSATTGSDTVNTDVCVNGDLIDLQTTGTGTVNAIGAMSVTQYIAPAGGVVATRPTTLLMGV